MRMLWILSLAIWLWSHCEILSFLFVPIALTLCPALKRTQTGLVEWWQGEVACCYQVTFWPPVSPWKETWKLCKKNVLFSFAKVILFPVEFCPASWEERRQIIKTVGQVHHLCVSQRRAVDVEGPWRWWSLNFILKLAFGSCSWLVRVLSWSRGGGESTFYCCYFILHSVTR